MFNYYCLNPIAQVGLEKFKNNFVKTENVEEAEGILVRSAAMHDMELSDKLLAVARAGAGVNNIPLDKCAQKGIVVFNTPGANANGVKELVFAGMLLAARDVVGGIEWAKTQVGNEDVAKATEKEKKKFAGTELQDKKLGIIGLGAIGVKVANAAKHLGMEVYGYDPYVSVDAAWNLSRDVKHVLNVEEIYENCDFITVHVPLLDIYLLPCEPIVVVCGLDYHTAQWGGDSVADAGGYSTFKFLAVPAETAQGETFVG